MNQKKETGPDKKKLYMTYGVLGVGLLVALVMKNVAFGLIVGLVGVSVVDYIDKRNR